MTYIERHNRYSSLSDELRTYVALNMTTNARKWVEPIERWSPRYIYVASFSVHYHVPSVEDWFLKVVFYDVCAKQLKVACLRFADVHVGAAWDKTDSTFTPLIKPECAGVEVLQGQEWLNFGEQLFNSLGMLARAIHSNKKIETPRHKITGHPLIDHSYFTEERRQG